MIAIWNVLYPAMHDTKWVNDCFVAYLVISIWNVLYPTMHDTKQVNDCLVAYLVIAIWNVLYPAMHDAKRVSDCLPDPPTPTRSALPPGDRIIRDILIKCVIAS